MRSLALVCSLLAALLLIPAPALAADATGVWRGEVALPNGQSLPFVARLTQEGARITGRLDGINGAPDVEIIEGRVDGETIAFSGVRRINGEDVRFNYTARFVDDDTLDFTIVRDDGSAAPLSSRTTRARE